MRIYFKLILAGCLLLFAFGCTNPPTPLSDEHVSCIIKTNRYSISNADVFIFREEQVYFGKTDSVNITYSHLQTPFSGKFNFHKPRLANGNLQSCKYTVLVGAKGHCPIIVQCNSTNLPKEIRLLPSTQSIQDLEYLQNKWSKLFNNVSDENKQAEALTALTLLYSRLGKKTLPLIKYALDNKKPAARIQAVSLLGWLTRVRDGRSLQKLSEKWYQSDEIMELINYLIETADKQGKRIAEVALDQLALVAYRRFNNPKEARIWWEANRSRPRKQWMLDALHNNPNPKLKYRAAGDLVITGDKSQRGADFIAHAMKSKNQQEKKWALYEYNRLRIRRCSKRSKP